MEASLTIQASLILSGILVLLIIISAFLISVYREWLSLKRNERRLKNYEASSAALEPANHHTAA